MVRFLLERPIAVVMAFLAAVIIGVVTYFTLPVSILPDIDIPQITVRVSGEGLSSRELENTATAPLRRQLLQVGGISELKSETRDGVATIRLHFDYGVDTDLAFIEVNEKIDAAMNSLPHDIKRPKAIKASATDIPVVYLNMTLQDDRDGDFLELADMAENVVRRRIEQLPQVAMADVTGVPGQQLRIVPDRNYMEITGITISDIESALASNNASPGSMTVRDGYYEYNINITNQLRTIEDVRRVYLRKGNRLIQLGDFCEIDIVAGNPLGYSFFNGKRAVTLAIIKQSEENMDKLKDALNETIHNFKIKYPSVEFTQSRNQTELLDYTLNNLVQNLIIGFLLVFILSAVFMGDMRSSMVIGVSIIVSVIITFLLFFLFKVSINIISLSGMILAVGMMIDNSVIVTENITQYRQFGYGLPQACDAGTTEMITPMLSSSLTTVAVFVPLVFMSGIAGAIFRDQAFAITSGLASSYIVGIMLLPVLYRIIFRGQTTVKPNVTGKALTDAYNTVIEWCFCHKILCVALTLLTIPLSVVLFMILPVERMPQIDRDDMIVRIEWNENINIDENSRRVNALTESADTSCVLMHSAEVGLQDYMLDDGASLSASEAEIYIKSKSASELSGLTYQLRSSLDSLFPKAEARLYPSENIFEKIFSTSEPYLEARMHRATSRGNLDVGELIALESRFSEGLTPMRERISLVIDREKLILHNVSHAAVSRALKTAFKGNIAGTLRSYQQYLPIIISGGERTVEEVLSETLVGDVPLSHLITVKREKDLKSISAGVDGEYIPLAFNEMSNPDGKVHAIREIVEENPDWEVSFAGSVFSNRKMIEELAVILVVSLLLMYFILCAQFGNFIQPLIVLIEIPIDIAFGLLTLWLFGHTLNLMSAIGIIVTCGIVVNDSILKLDAINELRAKGTPLMVAVHTAGERRLRPIVMTSLTTIAAMLPLLFTDDLGSELQRPLAVAMIGSMVAGTFVSVFIIPIFYWFIYRKSDEKIPA